MPKHCFLPLLIINPSKTETDRWHVQRSRAEFNLLCLLRHMLKLVVSVHSNHTLDRFLYARGFHLTQQTKTMDSLFYAQFLHRLMNDLVLGRKGRNGLVFSHSFFIQLTRKEKYLRDIGHIVTRTDSE
jgi:hypothetical protein